MTKIHSFLFYLSCFSQIDLIISSWILCQVSGDEHFSKELSTIKNPCPKATIGFEINGEVEIISNNFLSGMENLRMVSMLNVNLETIESDAFKNLSQLRTLNFQHNRVKTIKSGSFSNLLKLKEIFMRNNSISDLEVGAFTNLPQMSAITLDQNQLTEIKSGVFENVTLVVLELSNNQISKIEKGALATVYRNMYGSLYMEVRFGGNKLQEIDPEAFNNSQATVLSLDKNKISSLRPGDLANLPELDTLTLTHNTIEEIPEGVFNGTKLRVLDLSHNQIAAISSGAFDDMCHLTGVMLNDNKLATWNENWFHGSFGDSTILKYITASNNLIENIPERTFRNLPPNNVALNLEGNLIKSISSNAFKDSTNLTRLILKNNKLEEWDENKVTVIYELDLRGNKIPCPEGGLRTFTAEFVWMDNCDE